MAVVESGAEVETEPAALLQSPREESEEGGAVGSSPEPSPGSAAEEEELPPFPPAALIACCSALFVNSIHLTILFPFIFFMVKDFAGPDSDERSVGYAAGMIGSAIMAGRAITAWCWGRAADRVGRKPVLLVGLYAVGILGPAFGFVQSEAQAIAVRFVAGMFGTLASVSKVMASEFCAPQQQSRAMSLLSVTWGLGTIIGPVVGSLLDGVWPAFPHAPPMILCGCCALTSAALCHTYVVETLRPQCPDGTAEAPTPAQTPLTESVCDSFGPAVASSPSEFSAEAAAGALAHEEEEMVELEICSSPATPTAEAASPAKKKKKRRIWRVSRPSWRRVRGAGDPAKPSIVRYSVMMPILVYCVFSFANIAVVEVLNVWAPTAVHSGGLGLSLGGLGLVNGVAGTCVLIANPTVFPRIERKYGPKKVTTVCSVLLVPFLASIAQLRHLVAVGRVLMMGTLLLWYSVIQVLSVFAFTALFMLINNSTTRTERGQAQGVAVALASVGKALGPASLGSILAASLGAGLPDVPWLVIALSAAATAALCSRLPTHLNEPCPET